MTSPNTAPSPELMTQAQQAFELIQGLEPDRNPAFTAVEQVKGTAMAKLFLEGYADYLGREATDESVKANPLGTAFANVNYVAGYYITGDDPNKSAGDQFSELIKPWAAAHDQITEQN